MKNVGRRIDSLRVSSANNILEGMTREFESNIFSIPKIKDDLPIWVYLRYGRECKSKDELLTDFSNWLDIALLDFQPIKKLYWRVCPKITQRYFENKLWRISARLAIQRQIGKTIKGDIRYPSPAIPPLCGEFPMPDIIKEKR